MLLIILDIIMSFDLVKEIYYFLLNNTFSTKASLYQKFNINRILNNKLSRYHIILIFSNRNYNIILIKIHF